MYYFIKKYQKYIFSLLFTLIVCFPLFLDHLYLGHDTLFHLSRIEGLATSISHLDFIPTIYPFKNDCYGYASALFYSDILLYPFAILYLFNVDIVICFKLCIIFFTFISSITSYNLIRKISKSRYAATISSLLYISSTYRLSNVYVRGALGEVISYAFLPIVLLGIYKLFYSKQNAKKELILGFSLLILSHNISFILACILFLLFIIINIKQLKTHIKDILISIICVTGLTSFFTFPMLEQLLSQEFFLESNTSFFYDSNITFPQLFVNKINFNLGGKTLDSLTLTPGLLLLLLPLFNFFHKPSLFVKHSLLISIIFIILTIDIIPLQYLPFLDIMQFIWRSMMLVCVLLLTPSTITLFKSIKPKLKVLAILALVIIINTLYLLIPCTSKYNSIPNDTEYSSLLDGSIIDPYYSAFYVRVEVAGADYLPVGCIDYKNFNYSLYNSNHEIINAPLSKSYNLNFKLDQKQDSIIIPKTYYKGYSVYNITDKPIKLPTYQDESTKLVRFDTLETSGIYELRYIHTPIQIISYITTTLSVILILRTQIYKKPNTPTK